MDEPPGDTVLAILSDPSLIYILIALLVPILGGSFFLSASEGAFFGLSAGDLKKFEQSRGRDKKAVARVMQEPIEVAGTISILRLFLRLFFLVVAASIARGIESVTLQVLLVILLLTLMIISEIAPRILGRKHSLKWTLSTVSFWTVNVRLLGPLNSWLAKFDRLFEYKDKPVSEEELNKVLELATEGKAGDDEKEILRSVVNFETLTVKQVMRHRREISAVNHDLSFRDLIKIAMDSGYTRLPVFGKNPDKTEGMLYTKDLLPFIDQDNSFQWHTLIRPSFDVPEYKKVDALLKDFQERRVLLAIVKDAQGKTSGLITLADIVEIVIADYTDDPEKVK